MPRAATHSSGRPAWPLDLHSAGVNWHEAQQHKKKPACVWITLERIGEMLYILQNAFSTINISGFHWITTTVARARRIGLV